uniref:Uncharacterized protein n=1 Tax=Athene cunicularia TaxID=194338 RepID=A0A663M6J7_ATHCN
MLNTSIHLFFFFFLILNDGYFKVMSSPSSLCSPHLSPCHGKIAFRSSGWRMHIAELQVNSSCSCCTCDSHKIRTEENVSFSCQKYNIALFKRSCFTKPSHSSGSLEHSAPPAFQKHSLSSVLNRSSLRERFSSSWPSPANGDEIHKRVKNILRTHSARQRLIFQLCIWISGGFVLLIPLLYLDLIIISYLLSVDSSPVHQKTTVHLNNGEYWSSRAAVYKGKPHRVIFEESLEKIYRNMYRKASGTVSDQKTHS